MDRDDKARDAAKPRGANPSTDTSEYGKHRTTELQPGRPNKRKMGNTETAGLTKDKRIELAGIDMDQACAQFEEKMRTRGYRPFVDQSGFVYLFTMVRKDILKNRLAKHRMKVRYASHFSSQHDSKSSKCHQAGKEKSQQSQKGKVFRPSEDPEKNSRLPPCPVPMYFFPKSYPYSRNAVIESSLPRYLRPSNPKLRVRIPDPWALSLQLFERDPASAGPGSTGHVSSVSGLPKAAGRQRPKAYACYSIHTLSGQIYVQSLAPSGSTFDFAWEMFCYFFNKRVGVDWNGVKEGWKKKVHYERPLSDKPHGEDGADDGECSSISKPTAPHHSDGEDEAVVDSVDIRSRKPSVTVLMNMHEHIMEKRLEIQAKTPESGW